MSALAGKLSLFILATIHIACLLALHEPGSGSLQWALSPRHVLSWTEHNTFYLLLLGITLAFPLPASFFRVLGLRRHLGTALKAILLVATPFILLDSWFARAGIWGFNPRYVQGWRLGGLPVEEILFFIAIPFACLFLLHSWRHFLRRPAPLWVDKYLSPLLILLFFGLSFYHWDRVYTSSTQALCGWFLLGHYLYGDAHKRSWYYLAYLSSLLPFFLINGALTGYFSSQPVVLYNPDEYLGIRLGTIPLDDLFYNFALLWMTFTAYDALLSDQRKTQLAFR